MAVKLSPIGNGFQFLDSNGKPLNAGQLFTYDAGTTTPEPTYTTSAGNVQNANPIVLGVDGRPPNEIWLTAGVAYKFILEDSLNNVIATYDNLSGINDINVSTTVNEWISASSITGLTYVSATSFSVTGDQTSILTVNRRIKTTNTGGTIYSYISASSFGSSITTVTVVNDSGSLDSGLSALWYGIINSVNSSLFPSGLSQVIKFTGANTHSGTETFSSMGTVTMNASQLQLAQGANIAAAATVDLSTATGNTVTVTNSAGTNTITSFGTTPAGTKFTILFSISGGTVNITYDATKMIIAGAASINPVKDKAIMELLSLGSGNVQILSYKYARTNQDMSGSRTMDTGNNHIYQNLTGQDIVVNVSPISGGTNQGFIGYVDTVTPPLVKCVDFTITASTLHMSSSMTVPHGSYYKLVDSGAGSTVAAWSELR